MPKKVGLRKNPVSARKDKDAQKRGILKCPTGITGLDQITEGGLPQGRPTLVCGSAGCGKTILAMEFLVRGATECNEPGVFLSFEETKEELAQNVTSMGFDLAALCASGKLFMDYVDIDRSEVEVSGEYDLEGLFIRLGAAIDAVGAKRVVLDALEALFAEFGDTHLLRVELRRLFSWLKARGVTALITAESGDGKLTRQGIEEYVADCVIFLDHRVEDQTSIRRLRVVKYRGTLHGTSEYPFLIGQTGFSVLPLSSLRLDHKAPLDRVSSGVPRLDMMLGGKGFYRGTSILISGVAGTGKSSLATHFVHAACQRGKRALYMASELSPDEVIRNMRSIGIDLQPLVNRGLLRFYAARPASCGLEKHLVTAYGIVADFKPDVVVVDPITNFAAAGGRLDVKSLVTRLIDLFKSREITTMFTNLTSAESGPDLNEIGFQSQMDSCLLLRNLESNGERTRGLFVLKSRGMAHSNQIREFVLSDHGVQLLDVYLGPAGFVTGSARVALEAKERFASVERKRVLQSKANELKQNRQQLHAQIAKLRFDFERQEQELSSEAQRLQSSEQDLQAGRMEMGRVRQADKARTRGNGRT